MWAGNAQLGFDYFWQGLVYVFHLLVVLCHLPRVFVVFQFDRVTFLTKQKVKFPFELTN